ncbi:hypothetical protein ScPMuIL_016740 [Solemya velum]
MLLQEPVQAAIWDALNHYAYSDATFLAERLHAEVSSDDALYLLATCYYRVSKPMQAYMLLQKFGCPTPQCKYLMARCCLEINRLPEAESILAGNVFTKSKAHDEIEAEFGTMACHVYSLLGNLYSKSERTQKAADCYRKSLKLNPLLWSSYEQLCQLGEKVDVTQIFHCPAQTQSTPLVQQSQSQTNTQQSLNNKFMPNLQTPLPLPTINYHLSITPENKQDFGKVMKADAPIRRHDQTWKVPDALPELLTQPLFHSPLTPSFGILPLDTPSPQEPPHSMPFITPSPVSLFDAKVYDPKAPKKPVTRRNQNQNQKPPVFSQSGNTNTCDVSNQQSGFQINPPPVRRSSRLFGNSSSVKENNKSQVKSHFTSTKAVNRKSKSRVSRTQQEHNELNKELISDTKPASNTGTPLQAQILQMQQQSLAGVLQLLQSIGKAYQALCQYKCEAAIQQFSMLPEHQYNTAWVLCQIGRAYFEAANYQKAEKIFSEVRRLEPYHMGDMEIYSTTLWHLQKEVELSTLAQELLEMDKNSPEAWCATGNCFSLQKEHDTAIKFFQRSIQVDPNFAYAYTLLGHEYVFTEELDKALSCFRNAIRVDSRHYNAWYGVGMIFYKQEKFSLAEVHFRKALLINPQSSPLSAHIGVVQHALQKSELALHTLNKAIAADPRNPLCKFHRASILCAMEKHKDALEELEELKQIVPKESLVYFLIGKVHKKLGNTHLALINFSWATELDPKGTNNQIKESIDKHYVTEDDDSVARISDAGLLNQILRGNY